MKMTLFALGVKCGFLGAMGLTNVGAAAARLKKPSADSSPVRARPVNPPPVCHRNSRRVRRQNCRSFIVGISVVLFSYGVRRFLRRFGCWVSRETQPQHETNSRETKAAKESPHSIAETSIHVHELVRVQRQQTVHRQRPLVAQPLLLD